MAAGRHLPDLSALVRGLQRRWGGRPARGSPAASTTSRTSGSRRSGSARSSSRRWPTSATTSATTATSTRSSARSKTSTSSSPNATPATSSSSSTGSPTTAPTSTRGSRSRSAAKTNAKRDWYTWRDEPNDWVSVFKACGAAWTLDPATGQYYLHSFMPQQPDLNWENPEVVAAMHDTIRFWFDRGVDGLRLDAIAKIAKDPLLRDQAGAHKRHDEDWESIHGFLRGIRKVVDEYDDRMIVGEVALQDLHRVVAVPRVRRPAAHGAQLRLHRPGLGRGGLRRTASPTSSASPRRPPGPRGFSPTTTRTARARASTTTGSATSASARSS